MFKVSLFIVVIIKLIKYKQTFHNHTFGNDLFSKIIQYTFFYLWSFHMKPTYLFLNFFQIIVMFEKIMDF